MKATMKLDEELGRGDATDDESFYKISLLGEGAVETFSSSEK
jgi:hypothetical protein